ncbi:predicted protein [Chaetomium globosum CBS 148.51]|uniref:Uncharacterized protein n=1 Tax=Chaetomium globosum (strain ATCC 6205 / CBS 148.51 / DSM 1962 / NBRC 6347 / NRRL 1970) TaxID=306901 RepID=Q2GTZ7_CHAGB|nr:uncharacterized protein CHGG_08557 [Chaetomium globosum CBS 148.51]EAQ84543.1 predicted protein [Chaetomium globosum CBS 148.51]
MSPQYRLSSFHFGPKFFEWLNTILTAVMEPLLQYINHDAVSADDPREAAAGLDQQDNHGSLRGAPAGAQQLNPALVVFLNTILIREFYGRFENIGPVLVKSYAKVMPYRQLLQSIQLPLNVLINEYRRGGRDRVRPMLRAWTGLLEWILETQKDQKILQGAGDNFIAALNDHTERGEIQEVKYYSLTGIETTLCVVEMDNKRAASVTMDVFVRGLEIAPTCPYAAQFAAIVEDTFQKINLSITALSLVQKRLSLNTRPHAWLTMVFGWEGDPWLLEVSVETAAVLLQWPAQQTD